MNDKFDPEVIGKETRFSSTNQPENVGRKRNIFKDTQKNYDMSIEDMRQMLIDLLSLKPEELKELIQNKETPAFKLVIASAIIDSIKKGNWTQVNYMADRLFGRTTEKHEITTPEGLIIEFKNLSKNAKEDI
jgi:hypothetical protein